MALVWTFSSLSMSCEWWPQALCTVKCISTKCKGRGIALCYWWCYNTESQKRHLEGPFLETCSPSLALQSEADSNSLWQSGPGLVLYEPPSQMAKGCSVEDHRSLEVPVVSHYGHSHTVQCPSARPWQKEPNSMLTLKQIVPWPPS